MQEDWNLNEKLGKTRLVRIVNFYKQLWKLRYGFEPTSVSYPIVGSLIKKKLDSFSEIHIALFLVTYFEWRGVSGEDEYVHKRLLNNAFPITWFTSYLDSYMVYLRNVVGLDIENLSDVKKYISEYMKSMQN